MIKLSSICKVLFASALLTLALTSCSLGNGHTCSYSEWIEFSAPSCTNKGIAQRFCENCNDTQTKYLDALGHDKRFHEAKEPTCDETGWVAFESCARCGYSTYAPIPATGKHSYNTDGYCDVCLRFEDEGMHLALSEDGNSYIFSCYNGVATNIIIPSRYNEKPVTAIGEKAFYNCSGMVSITIPGTVTSIGSNAFEGCTSLKSVYAASLSSWNGILFEPDEGRKERDGGYADGRLYSNPMYYAEDLYLNGQLLVNLVIPDEITEISHFAFYNCKSLKSVVFHGGIKSVGASAFIGCENLESLYITDLVSFLNIKFFEYPAVAAYYSDANPMKYAKNVYLNGNLITDLVIPDGVTYIPQDFFANCKSLKSVYIPDSVKAIGYGAFENATNLSSVVFETVTGWETSTLFCSKEHDTKVSSTELANPQTAVFLLTEEYAWHDFQRK